MITTRYVPALAMVFLGALIVAPLLQASYAQTLSIETSADENGGMFFGEAVLQVVINDPDADDDSTVEDVTVDIDADPDSGSQGSLSLAVPETSDSSGRFEFFLVHESATAVGADDLDPINTAGVESDTICTTNCAPFVTFGSSGDLQVEADLYEEVTFDITVGDVGITVKYEEALGQLELDRSAYGSDSFVYVFIIDQDANLNPTDADEFTVDPVVLPNGDLLELGGGSIEGVVTFRETGDNTARFEGRYELGASIGFDSESLTLTLFDKANYNATLDADENDSGSTDEVSFTIGDTDGTVDVGNGTGTLVTWDAMITTSKESYFHGENVTVSIEDPDANTNAGATDTIDIRLALSSGASAVIVASESSPNTGVFEATFLLGLNGRVEGTELVAEGGETMVVSYVDERPADYATKIESGQDPEKEFTIEISTLLRGTGSTSLSSPAVMGPGGSWGPHQVGNQLVLGTTIENKVSGSQQFVVFLDVRDVDGISVYIAWQSGTLDASGNSAVEVSWTPEVAGEYKVRTFAVSSLLDGNVISEIASSSVAVGP